MRRGALKGASASAVAPRPSSFVAAVRTRSLAARALEDDDVGRAHARAGDVDALARQRATFGRVELVQHRARHGRGRPVEDDLAGAQADQAREPLEREVDRMQRGEQRRAARLALGDERADAARRRASGRAPTPARRRGRAPAAGTGRARCRRAAAGRPRGGRSDRRRARRGRAAPAMRARRRRRPARAARASDCHVGRVPRRPARTAVTTRRRGGIGGLWWTTPMLAAQPPQRARAELPRVDAGDREPPRVGCSDVPRTRTSVVLPAPGRADHRRALAGGEARA